MVAGRGAGLTRLALGLAIACAVLAPIAFADDTGTERVRITTDGQRAAKNVVVRKADLTGIQGLLGGIQTHGNVPFPLPCPTYLTFAPREGDIEVNGAATARWQGPGLAIVVDTHILRTAEMARLVWSRWATPAFVGCLKSAATDRPFTSFVSAARMSFPQVGSFAAAYRVVTAPKGRGRYAEDTILIASGRARIRLHVVAELKYAGELHQFDIALARLLAERALTA